MITALVLAVLIAGCENIDVSQISDEDMGRIAEKAIVCDEPYIRHASGCCLDVNGNKICDKDETRIEIPAAGELPERCTMPSGIACRDFAATRDQVTLIIQNAAGYDMEQVTVRLTGDVDANCQGPRILTNGDKGEYSCPGLFSLSKVTENIVMSYKNSQTGLVNIKTGEIFVKPD